MACPRLSGSQLPTAMSNRPSFSATECCSGDQKAMKEDLKCVPSELLAERRFISALTEMEGVGHRRKCRVYEKRRPELGQFLLDAQFFLQRGADLGQFIKQQNVGKVQP